MWGPSESSHELGILALVAEPHESVIMSIANDICVKVWDTPTAKTKKTRKNQNRCKKTFSQVLSIVCLYTENVLGHWLLRISAKAVERCVQDLCRLGQFSQVFSIAIVTLQSPDIPILKRWLFIKQKFATGTPWKTQARVCNAYKRHKFSESQVHSDFVG